MVSHKAIGELKIIDLLTTPPIGRLLRQCDAVLQVLRLWGDSMRPRLGVSFNSDNIYMQHSVPHALNARRPPLSTASGTPCDIQPAHLVMSLKWI